MHFLQLARRGLNVVLISRDLSKLKHEAKEIGEYRKGGELGNAALQAQGLRFDGAWSGRGRGVVEEGARSKLRLPLGPPKDRVRAWG